MISLEFCKRIALETMLKNTLIFLVMCFFSACQMPQNADTVSYTTTADQKLLLHYGVLQAIDDENTLPEIKINTTQKYQSIDGFGFALTQGSAEAISSLDAKVRFRLLNELFNPETGIGISVLRISIGASDLSNSNYTWADTPNDDLLADFKPAEPDAKYLIPILKEVKKINPAIKLMATPWTAPIWMKTNKAWIGGSLAPVYYDLYSQYLLKFLKYMYKEQLPIWAITLQNEPGNPNNEPSMLMTAEEQIAFINLHLDRQLKEQHVKVKVLVFDHNCDNTDYPISVLNNTRADGAAFHLYGGDIANMGKVSEQTGKSVYFTEQFTSVNGQFGGDLAWHSKNVAIGGLNNHARTIIEWNLATDQNFGPRTPGGCHECLGAITVKNDGSISRNVSYYIIAQVAKLIKPGAVRVGHSTTAAIDMVAFQNTDGSKALLAWNDKPFNQKVRIKDKMLLLPSKSVVAVRW